jgi:hypothetical protein
MSTCEHLISPEDGQEFNSFSALPNWPDTLSDLSNGSDLSSTVLSNGPFEGSRAAVCETSGGCWVSESTDLNPKPGTVHRIVVMPIAVVMCMYMCQLGSLGESQGIAFCFPLILS